MQVTTSTHILTLGEDHVYSLRKLGVAGDDSWLESRRGEAFDRRLRLLLHDTTLELFFENKSIGSVPLHNTAAVSEILALIEHWNLKIGPTDLATIKTAELLRAWPRLLVRRKFNVKCITYNCAGLLSEMALKRETWLQLIGKEQETEDLDVIVLSFQESDSLNRVKNSHITLQRVCDLSRAFLFKSHSLVSSVQLLGLMTVVFVKHKLQPHLSHLATSTSSTGFLRVWGNKGAVLTRFRLFADDIVGNGHEFVFVNCHLSAGEGITQLGRRKWELREIGSKFGISALARAGEEDDTNSISDVSDEDSDIEETAATPPSPLQRQHSGNSLSTFTGSPRIGGPLAQNDELELQQEQQQQAQQQQQEQQQTYQEHHEKEEEEGGRGQEEETGPLMTSVASRTGSACTLLMGDLNYRVLLSEKESTRKVHAKEWEGLLAHDSLLLERRQGLVFPGFEEAQIDFAPTFKYEVGTRKLKGRVPSYTDRIMYRSACRTTVQRYDSLPDCIASDHRPVTFTATVEGNRCVSPEVREEVVQKALMIADTAENNARPKLDVDQSTITLKGAPLDVLSATIVVRNKGSRPVNFVVENAHIEAARIKQMDAVADEGVNERAEGGESPASSAATRNRSSVDGSGISAPAEPTSASGGGGPNAGNGTAAGTTTTTTTTLETAGAASTEPGAAEPGTSASEGAVNGSSDEFSQARVAPGSQGSFIDGSAADVPPLPLFRPDSVAMTPKCDVVITPAEGLVSASNPTEKLMIDVRVGLKSRDVILLVKPKQSEKEQLEGIDLSVPRYVFVKIEAAKSVLGAPLSSLKTATYTNGVPVPVYMLGEYLRSRGRTVPRLFRTQAERTLFQQVLKWLDTDSELDVEVLDAANVAKPHAGDYAVAQILLTLFYYLPEQLLGPNAKRKQSTAELKRTIMYTCQLLTEIVDTESIDEVGTLDVWATALYDRNDRKAGPNEKRAYLRSMLIMSSSTTKEQPDQAKNEETAKEAE